MREVVIPAPRESGDIRQQCLVQRGATIQADSREFARLRETVNGVFVASGYLGDFRRSY